MDPLASFFSAIVFAVVVAAQDSVPRHALAGTTPIHTAPADPVGGAYGTWAAGDAYKASFHAGMTFVPYLGRDYPVTRMVSWQTESAVLGSRDLRGEGASQHEHDALHYAYHFAGIVERYEVRAEGLEQSFVVAQPGAGELRIVGRLGGNLQAIAGADGGVAFTDGERVLVTYGGAVAIDANGARLPVQCTLDGERIVLRVGAADVDKAAFPLVVDPLLAPIVLGTHPTADPDSVDIARDDDTNDLAVCYLRHVSAVDQDAWVRQFRNDFTNAPGGDLVFTDITASWGIQNIRICSVGPEDDFVAVVNRSLPTVYLRYWVQPAASLLLNTTVSYAANPGVDNQWFADIGGIETNGVTGLAASGTSAMCVYQLDDSAALTPTDTTTIWAQRIDVAGAAVVLGAQFQISGAGNDHDFPSITKVCEGQIGVLPACWVAVWQRYDSADPAVRDWDVVGTQVFDDDTAAGTFEAQGSALNDAHRMGPKVEGQRGRFLVAYGELPRAGVLKGDALQGKSMVAQRFDWPNGGAITAQPSRTFRGPLLLQQMIIADVAYDTDTDSHWTVLDLDTVDGYLRVHRLGYRGALLAEIPVSGVAVGAEHNGLGGICYDDDGNRFVFAYGIPLDGPQNPVFGQYLTFAAEVAPSLMGPTCRPILPSWVGRDQDNHLVPANDQQIGNQFDWLRVNGTPAGTLHFMVLSTNTAFVPILHAAFGGGCNQLVSLGAGYIGILPVQVGADVAWNFPLPEGLAPFTLRAQDVFLDPGDGKFYTSYRLDVPLVK